MLLIKSEKRIMIYALLMFENTFPFTLVAKQRISQEKYTKIETSSSSFVTLSFLLFDELKISNSECGKIKQIQVKKSDFQTNSLKNFLLILRILLNNKKNKFLENPLILNSTRQIIENSDSITNLKSQASIIRKCFEFCIFDFRYEKLNIIEIKETIPSYNFSPFHTFVRENFVENHFRMKILKEVYIANDSSTLLADILISILINLIAIFFDKEKKNKPIFTAKLLVKLLSQKEIIPKSYICLVKIFSKIKMNSMTDILTLIFNFSLQFHTFSLKNADSIDKSQTKNYNHILKAVLIKELENIEDEYNGIIREMKLFL